ncbi:MAG: hypothetical protein CR971_00800 [candidate division SR1 bacterium]|nr:MAG: hypothetical protein CR971_00800 [candidate division SR1 bacterium]
MGHPEGNEGSSMQKLDSSAKPQNDEHVHSVPNRPPLDPVLDPSPRLVGELPSEGSPQKASPWRRGARRAERSYTEGGIQGGSHQQGNKAEVNEKSIIPINYAFNPMFGRLVETFPNIELFFRIDDVGLLPFILPQLGYAIADTEQLWNEYEKILPENINTSMNKHNKTVYIPISTGCNQFCSYCIVPYARGLERNFEVEHIVNEAKMHLKNGVKEIVLLGQIVNKHPKFVEILQAILQLDGLEWLRYTSPYPTYYSDELLALHEQEEKLCPHIHIPLQSGSDPVLKKMFRGYTAQQAYDFLDKIKGLKRKISITTDIIVGFTDETEEDFQKTLDIVKYGSFDMIYIGVYSPRPGTYADRKLLDNVSREEKHDRWDRLNTLLNQCSKQNNLAEVGNIRKVLINEFLGVARDGVYKYAGYTDNMKQITIFSDDEIALGDFVQVEITKGVVFKLMGKKI